MMEKVVSTTIEAIERRLARDSSLESLREFEARLSAVGCVLFCFLRIRRTWPSYSSFAELYICGTRCDGALLLIPTRRDSRCPMDSPGRGQPQCVYATLKRSFQARQVMSNAEESRSPSTLSSLFSYHAFVGILFVAEKVAVGYTYWSTKRFT